jgi:hypothetical protein
LGLAAILPASAAQIGETFPLVYEFLDSAGPITQSPVTHAYDREMWSFAGRMVPNPILCHIQPLSDFSSGEERIFHVTATDGSFGLWVEPIQGWIAVRDKFKFARLFGRALDQTQTRT